ncbi:peptidase inhibitor family I36 protein [Streptomyces sp. NPDC003038]|uniref:peptidase inhibitor family I36 protein n=1 Tax=unclassified Streptomyces TaxID=2593676 RepID=UPI0033BC47CC
MKVRMGIASAVLALTAVSALPASASGTAEAPGRAAAETRTSRVFQGHGVEDCPRGFLCLYDNWDYNGNTDARILATDEDISHLEDHRFNDVTSSIYNHTDHVVRVYPHWTYQGVPATLFPGERLSLNGWNGHFNDQASSVRSL